MQVQKKIWPFVFRLGLQWNLPLTGLLSQLLQDHWSDFFRPWSECSPQCLVVEVPKKSSLSKNMAAVGHLWFFFIASPQKLQGEFEWTCLLGSPQCLVVQAPNQILVGRQISHFGSQLGLSLTFHSSSCYRTSGLEPLNGVDRNFPTLIVSVCSYASNKRILVKWWIPASLSVTIGHHAVGGEGVTGLFAQKPVPPGTIRTIEYFLLGRFTWDDSHKW